MKNVSILLVLVVVFLFVSVPCFADELPSVPPDDETIEAPVVSPDYGFLDKPINEFSVTEGFLLLFFVLLSFKFLLSLFDR